MKAFILPVISCAYVLSVLFAGSLWDEIYEYLTVRLDLSANQVWLLPVSFNLLVVTLGLPSIIKFLAARWRKEPVTQTQIVTTCLTVAAVVVCTKAFIFAAILKRQALAEAVKELSSPTYSGVFEAGKHQNGTYSNEIIGLAIDIPEHWHWMTLNSIRRTKASGDRALANEGDVLAEDIPEEQSGISTLLAVTLYPKTYHGYNPSLSLSAYDKTVFAKSGIPTLEAYVDGLSQLSHPVYLINEPSIEPFGREVGYYVHFESRLPEATIQQHVYATETETFYILATASVMEESDLMPFKQAIRTLRFSADKKRSSAGASRQ